MGRKQIERDYKKVAEKLMDLLCLITSKTVSEIAEIIKEVTEKDTKEQREFKNKDFHVVVWEDSERIGIETKWIKEGFGYRNDFGNNLFHIDNQWKTDLPLANNVWFGVNKGITSCIRDKECIAVSYTDIVKELEKADKLSREVSIRDVIEECKGVTDPNRLAQIISKYEFKDFTNNWVDFDRHSVEWLDTPIEFIYNGHQLRLKEQC